MTFLDWRRAALGVCLAPLLLTGCPRSMVSEDGSLEDRLTNRSFVLHSAEGFEVRGDEQVELQFEERTLTFDAGCNLHQVDYSICDGRLCATVGLSTLVACEEEMLRQDEWLSSFFESHPVAELDEPRLTLIGKGATLTFLDHEIESPALPLTGTVWFIDGLIDGDTVSHPDHDGSVQFNDDGTLQVFTPCSGAFGTFTSSDHELLFENVVYSDSACDSDDSRRMHAYIEATLQNGRSSFTIDGSELTLTRGTRGIVASAR